MHDRLDDLDAPGLVVVDGGEDRGHASTGLGLAHAAVPTTPAMSLSRNALPVGHRLAHARRVASIASPPLGATIACSPSKTLEALGVGGRQLDARARREELQRRRGLDLGRRPRSSGRCRAAARAVRRRGARRRLEPERPEVGVAGARRGGVALRPAHAAAADLVERQAGVERDGLDELRAVAIGPVSTPASAPRRAPSSAEHLPAGAHVARAADRRAQALHAAVGVRDRALLLGVGLGREDDGRVLADARR